MKDLDFDELDKAVNSLMSSVPKAPPIKPVDDDNVLTLDQKLTGASPPPLPSFDSPHSNKSDTSDEQLKDAVDTKETQPVVATPTVSFANRRNGRFMDVVHPSSDMKKVSSAKPTTRQGLTIDPRPEMHLLPAEVEDSSSHSEINETTVSSVEPKEDTAVTSEWPDPLELQSSQTETSEGPHDSGTSDEDSVADAPTEPQELPLADQQSAPLTSPFLTDTKVEKRPLGGASAPTEPEVAEEPDHAPVLGAMAQEDTSHDDTTSPKEPAAIPVVLPEEFRSDVMAIESDTHPSNQSTEPTSSVPPALSIISKKPTETTAGSNSITQQYRDEPSTGDQTSGSIFDTTSYHQPLSHPVNKKSGWLWVIGVIAVLLLGAGGGAALYFLGII